MYVSMIKNFAQTYCYCDFSSFGLPYIQGLYFGYNSIQGFILLYKKATYN